jgi:hypothetical protein
VAENSMVCLRAETDIHENSPNLYNCFTITNTLSRNVRNRGGAIPIDSTNITKGKKHTPLTLGLYIWWLRRNGQMLWKTNFQISFSKTWTGLVMRLKRYSMRPWVQVPVPAKQQNKEPPPRPNPPE